MHERFESNIQMKVTGRRQEVNSASKRSALITMIY